MNRDLRHVRAALRAAAAPTAAAGRGARAGKRRPPPAAAGTTGAWPVLRGDSQATGVSISALRLPLRVAWRHRFDQSAIEATAGYIQRRVGKHLETRTTPRLTFILDETQEKQARVERLIEEALLSDRATSSDETSSEEDDGSDQSTVSSDG